MSGRQLKTSTSGFPTIMGDAAGDKDGGSGLPQMDDQEQIQVKLVEGCDCELLL